MGLECSSCCATADEQKNELSDDFGKMIINQVPYDGSKQKNTSPDRKVRYFNNLNHFSTHLKRLVKTRCFEKLSGCEPTEAVKEYL
jgi:hypothetical protein